MNNWLEGVGLKEKERAGRKDDMLNHPIGSGDDPALSATATSEIKKLKEEAAKITRESAIAEVSGVERVKALLLEIGRIKSEISNEKDPVEQARLGVELARTEAEKARTEQSNAKEIIRLKEQAARLSMNTALSEMGAAERVEAITKGIAGLKEDMAKAADEKTKAEIALEIEKQNAELARARKEEEKADRSEARGNRYQAPEVNALQRIGAYVSPEAAQMKSTAERSEQHLQAIRHGIDELQRNQRKTQF